MRFNLHISRFSSWVLYLLSVLFIITGGTIVVTRRIDADRLSCVQIDNYIFDIPHRREVQIVRPPLPIYDQLYRSPDGNYIVHDTRDAAKHLVSFSISDSGGQHIRLLANQPDRFMGWSADSRYFTTHSALDTPQTAIWSVADPQATLHLDVASIRWLPTGHQFAYFAEDGLHVVNAENQASILYPLPVASGTLIWSPDEKYLTIVSADQSYMPNRKYLHTILNLASKEYVQYELANEVGFWMKDSSAYLVVSVRQVHDYVQADLVALNPSTGTLKLVVPDVYSLQASYDDDPRYFAYTFLDKGKWSAETFDLETGRRAVILNRTEAILTVPTWSLDGEWLTIVGTEPKHGTAFQRVHVIIAHPDGTRLQDISDISKDWLRLQWIHPLRWLAYASEDESGSRFTLVDVERGKSFPVLGQLTQNTFIGRWSVTFSPDGQQATLSFGASELGYEDTYMVSLKGDLMFSLSPQRMHQMAWSPDGAAIAFISTGSSTKLTIVDMDGHMLMDEIVHVNSQIVWMNCQPYSNQQIIYSQF